MSEFAYEAAVSIVNRLDSATYREFGRIYGVMDELERLKSTVESFRAVLLDAEVKQEQSHAVQSWIRRLKDDVLYPVDNLLDEFLTGDMRFQRYKATKAPLSISLDMHFENIQWKISDLQEEMKKFNLAQNDVVVVEHQRMKTSSLLFTPSNIIEIEREDAKKRIISLLKQPHEDQLVSVIAIVGMGGMGKTTLTKLVYNDGEVTKFFEKSMWICVSDNFDVKTIVMNMLKSLLPDEKIDDKLSLDNLLNELRENLTGKRYLLVLDDVWNENYEKWDQLRTYLTWGTQNSKVVVTTRSTSVAQTMGVSVPYVLKGWTIDESWNLLKNIVTNGDETKGVNQTLESIGKKIAEKCRGVPLAIRTLGGLLQGKSEEREWVDVLRGDFCTICEDEESIMPQLKLSYKNLSPQMKQCFVYCSLYPKGWQIEKDELIQLWMAQSYLEFSGEHDSMEDIGNQFVMTFLKELIFEDAKMDDDGHVYSFKMHDLMHDLAMLVGGSDCCYLNSDTRLVGSPVHVSLKPNANTIRLLASLDQSRLRTLILLSSDEEEKGFMVCTKQIPTVV